LLACSAAVQLAESRAYAEACRTAGLPTQRPRPPPSLSPAGLAGSSRASAAALVPREYALVLKPEELDVVLGPRTVQFGGGIEYILPNGFTEQALHFPWEIRIS
jgi:hypothetical protein